MSQTEFHAGKLQPIIGWNSVEDWCHDKCLEEDITLLTERSWRKQFEYSSAVADKFIIHNEKVYVIIDHYESEDSEYFMKLYDNPDGSISFVGSFYNGGTCFSEMIEEALTEKFKSK